jgi:cell shape-determining protein MreC
VGGSRGRTAFLVALCGCAWLSLRPDARVEAWLDVALVPARALAEVLAPWRWMRQRSVRAAEAELAEKLDAEIAQRRALHEAERAAARPSEAQLSFGRRFVHAEVVGRRPEHFDQLEVRLDSGLCDGIEPGMPVCSGDAFVGRVVEIDAPQKGRAWVELATARRFAVGARIETDGVREEVRCVVGGLASMSRADSGRLFLSVTAPSARVLPQALARVDERLSPLARFAAEADGFRLGIPEPGGDGEWVLRPLVDFSSGLYQLCIVAPAEIAREPDRELADELGDERWKEARVISIGEPSARRDGFELALGRWQGALDGAALVVGARLLGKIVHAGALSSDARRLGDPGGSVHALARIEGRAAPVVLGRIVSLGRDEDGALLFHWPAPLGIPGATGERVRATLFTGAGEPLVPRGLLIGEADLPTGVGPHRLRIEAADERLSIGHVRVRLAPPPAPEPASEPECETAPETAPKERKP